MGVQDRDGAGRTLKLLVVVREHPHCLPATAGHQGIEGALMAPCQRPERLRQSESQEKILGGHLFSELTFQPLLAFMVLAVRTVAMTAGVGHEKLAVALGALRQHVGTGCSAAMLHGAQRLEMGRQQRILVLVQERGLEGFDDG